MFPWDSEFLWDLEWVGADGTPLEQEHGLKRETAEQQGRQWLKEKPGTRVYLYRRRGEVSVLMRVWNAG